MHGGVFMHRFRFAALVAVVVFGFSSAVTAADLPTKAPVLTPRLPAIYPWTGFYIGANAGAGWSRESYTTAPGGTLVTLPFFGSLGWGQSISGSSDTGFTGGIQVGYNWQVLPTFVLGVETDFQYYGAKVNSNTAFTSTVGGTGVVATNISSKTPWFGTLRGRLGYQLQPDILLYVTGGLAYGHEKISSTISASMTNGTLVETFPFSMSKTSWGYAVGGGGEWRIQGHWSIKAEYLYVSLASNQSQPVATTFFGPGALSTDVMTLSSSSRNRLNIVRLGVNYWF